MIMLRIYACTYHRPKVYSDPSVMPDMPPTREGEFKNGLLVTSKSPIVDFGWMAGKEMWELICPECQRSIEQ